MRVKKEINIKLGANIKQSREAAGLTQEALAEAVDVSPQYLSDLERGVVGVSIPTLKRICLALGVSSDQLLFGQFGKNNYAPLLEKCQNLSPKRQQLLRKIVEHYLEAMEEDGEESSPDC